MDGVDPLFSRKPQPRPQKTAKISLGIRGIVVVLMPNDTVYYYASDNREFTWLAVLQESDKIYPMCDK
jgi:hypothetical protein